MNISSWPKEERPREKLLIHGARALSDAELIAIFLRCGIKGKNAVNLARELLQKFGDIKALLDLEKQDFCCCLGLGEAKYAQLQAALELSRRYLANKLKYAENIKDLTSAKLYCAAQLGRHKQEVFAMILLNSSNSIIHFAELFFGTINRANVYPREVVKKVLLHNAAAVILVHNHVSGVVIPSGEDKKVTKQLQEILNLIDVKVLDHIIVGAGECFSFAEVGML